ncbi:TrkA family potassium uptake protein [Peptoniphilus sp. MSJ-1]|uniref:TrkA family potassium uptake protein n=1 Tax=Peptoniphilus ovalis TaxID=2841503 RepID=A0ABS6FIW4_9FIRM|nr:TrkA family potassium uptake protein [Peptoniphilus ovalis]MBU5670118.1 TrkA family potassium uptake protein [Peptoniphilus ovalis]
MKTFIVFGCGRFGSTVARRLYDLNNDVVVVDSNMEKIDKISSNVTEAIVCDLEDEGAVDELGLNNFDVAVVAIAENLEAAIMAVLASKEAGIPRIVAKAANYRAGKILQKVGADKIIYPERDMGYRLANNLSNKNLIDSFEVSKGYGMFEIEANDKMIDKTLDEIRLREDYNFIVLMIKRKGEIIVNPTSDFQIRKDDTLTILGADEEIKKFNEEN